MTPNRFKFRVWDRKIKAFETCRNTRGEGLSFSHDWKGIYTASEYGYKIIMQSTGLLDKNGKEIFEGDWVKFKDIKGGKRDGEVKFGDCSFYIQGECNSDFAWMDYTDIKIIGNIYESPELLQ